MWKLVPILVFSLIMSCLSDRRSIHGLDEWGENCYTYKEKICYFLMAFFMAVFVGLRTSGNDTYAYIQGFNNLQSGFENLKNIDWEQLAGAPGRTFLAILLKTMGGSANDYLMLFALFTVGTYLWFIRKYSSNIVLSIFYFFTMGVYVFTFAALKQTAAVAFLMIATDRAIQRKNINFLFWVIVAELFHPYAFVYLIVPFMFFKPWSRKTWWLLSGTVFVAFGLQKFLGPILEVTYSFGANYNADSFLGEGVNFFRVMVVWVPVVISFLGRDMYSEENRIENLFINLSIVCAMIMFIGLFGTANYFARLANYFLIFQTLSLPWLFRVFNHGNRSVMVFLSVICFSAYFYYENGILRGGFDRVYFFMSFFEYLQQLRL